MSLHPIARLLLLFLSYLLAVMRGDRFSSATRLANSLAMLPAEKRGVKVRLRCDPVIGSNPHTGDRKPAQTRVIFFVRKQWLVYIFF